MSKVASLASRRVKAAPHRVGPARCLNCKHEWEAISPCGTTVLDCPKCETSQGLYLGLAQTERPQWKCNCGEFTFFVDTAGIYCAHCGTRPSFP